MLDVDETCILEKGAQHGGDAYQVSTWRKALPDSLHCTTDQPEHLFHREASTRSRPLAFCQADGTSLSGDTHTLLEELRYEACGNEGDKTAIDEVEVVIGEWA